MKLFLFGAPHILPSQAFLGETQTKTASLLFLVTIIEAWPIIRAPPYSLLSVKSNKLNIR
jgi:hypothetical protein